MTAIDLYDKKLYYRIKHPEFNPNYGYRALHHVLPASETGWSYITFINERGMTYTVRVDRTLCLTPAFGQHGFNGDLAVELSDAAQEIPWPKPTQYNPDLNTDL